MNYLLEIYGVAKLFIVLLCMAGYLWKMLNTSKYSRVWCLTYLLILLTWATKVNVVTLVLFMCLSHNQLNFNACKNRRKRFSVYKIIREYSVFLMYIIKSGKDTTRKTRG